jgi:MerR family transcriptional regulator, copper efflux regulator
MGKVNPGATGSPFARRWALPPEAPKPRPVGAGNTGTVPLDLPVAGRSIVLREKQGGDGMAQALTVGQLARATGVPAKTIRYYEEVGVLPPPSRSATGYRQYTVRGVQRLVFIRRARALGLSLHHLNALTAALDGEPRAAMRPRLLELVRAQLSAVRQQIAELQLLQRQLEETLHRLLMRPPANHSGGCRCLEIEDVSARSANARASTLGKGNHRSRRSRVPAVGSVAH